MDFNRSTLVDSFDLAVALESFNLDPLNSFAPSEIAAYAQVAGFASFDGQLTGTLENPRAEGVAQLDGFALNDLLFEPLAGPIALSLAEGGRANLRGSQDLIALTVSENAWPTNFEIRNQDFVAQGYGRDRQLHADILQLPLASLNIRPPATSALRTTLGTVEGLLTASIDANLQDFSNPDVQADLTVEQPQVAPLDAEVLTASLRYQDRTATLTRSELQFDESRYLLTGSATLGPEIQYEGVLSIPEGRIEDLAAIAQQLDLSAFGDR